MSNKFFIGIAAAFFAVFAIGIGAVVGITELSDRTTISDVGCSVPSEMSRVAAPAFVPLTPKAPAVNESAPPVAGVTKLTGILVTDSDINQLADAVKLGAQKKGDVGKDVWAKETPIAKRLLNGMCDCDQRNWLKHFVATGQEAISGSANYDQSVQLLATLHRSDSALTANRTPH